METKKGKKKIQRKRKFKSYYVVWKLHTYTFLYMNYKGLNRTMQYGNKHLDYVCLNC